MNQRKDDGNGRNHGLTASLLERFRQLLADGSLAPGSRLPPERELARQFGVSRNSLRQALQVLGVMGVLEQRTGYGTYLRNDASAILTEPLRFMVLLDAISHEELFEARLIVEPELAYRAAERATLKDIHALEAAVEAMQNAGNDRLRVAEADLAFHDSILCAAGNRVCQSMFSVVQRSLLGSIIMTGEFVGVEHTLNFHRAILAAINERKPQAARQAMMDHLKDAREVMAKLASKRAPADLRRRIALAKHASE